MQRGSTEGQPLSSGLLGSQHRNSPRLKIFNKSVLLMLTSQYWLPNEGEMLKTVIMWSAS